MTKLRIVAAAATAIGIVVLAAVVPTASTRTSTNIPVAVTFANATTDGVTSDGRQDSYTSSLTNVTTWAAYVDGMDDTYEELSGGDDYVFNLHWVTSPGPRNVCFNYEANNGNPVTPALPPGVDTCINVQGAMNHVLNDTGAVALSSMTYNQQQKRRLHIGWVGTDGGVQYQYHFAYGRDWNSDGTPDTAPVLVTCSDTNAQGGNPPPCKTWTVTPDYTVNATTTTAGYWMSLSRQQMLNAGGKLGAETLVGIYSMPFTMNIAVE